MARDFLPCYSCSYYSSMETHNTVWNKVSANIKKKIDRKPVYNKKFLKTEMKSYGNKVTDF